MPNLLSSSRFVFLLVWAANLATPHSQAAAPPSSNARLDFVMREWAKANEAVRSMRYRFTETRYDPIFRERKVTKGEVQLLKPDLLRVDRYESKEPTILLITKRSIHLFNPEMKAEAIWKQPNDRSFFGEKSEPPKRFWEGLERFGEAFQQQAYWFFAGLPVDDLSRRFDVKLTNEDAHYIYINISVPERKGMNRAEELRVVLHRENFQVRQIWISQVNGSATTLDFEKPDVKAQITEESIRKNLPRGWKRVGQQEEVNRE